MIYTFGDKNSYENGLLKCGADFAKLGKGEDHAGNPYKGGAVWKTKEEAEAYAKRYAWADVYGVVADWDTDTEQLEGEPFRRLLKTSQIVKV